MSPIVRRNFDALEVLPFSGVIDNGSDVATREARASNGELVLNGIGGEVYRRRDLAHRGHDLREVVWRFFCGYDPAILTTRFDEVRYCERIEEDLGEEVRATGREWSTLEAEDIYLKFFFRSWAGHNTSINNAFSSALTPFRDDLTLYQEARQLPHEMRWFGRFEAALIHALDPKLARYSSAYGHPFNSSPPDMAQNREKKQAYRSPASFRQERQPKQRTRWPAGLGRAHLSMLFDPDFPQLSAYTHPHRVTDPNLFRRICTLEYAFERLGVAVQN